MRFHIDKQYDCTAYLMDWLNPNDIGLDQYEYVFDEIGDIKCWFGVAPASGRLTLEVPAMLNAKTPVIMNPVNKHGVPLGKANYVWMLSPPIPQINAYGQVHSFRYNLVEQKT